MTTFNHLIDKIKEAFGGEQLLLQQPKDQAFPVNIYRVKHDGIDLVAGNHTFVGTFHNLEELESFYDTIKTVNTTARTVWRYE